MAIYAIRKGVESNESLQRRFKKQHQDSRVTPVLRGRRTHSRALNRRSIRLRALKREHFRAARKKNQYYSNM